MHTVRPSRRDARLAGALLPAAVVLTLSGGLVAAALGAQERGRVEGTATLDGDAVPIAWAAIYAEEEGFYDPSDPTWTLVLTAEELSPRDVDDPGHDPSLEIGVTWTSEFGDEPSLEVLSNTLYVDGTSISGGTTPTLEITSRDDQAWVGRVFLPEEQESFDRTYVYDLAFHAPLVDPSAPIGDPLPEGGGEPGAAYVSWTEAIHARDLDALRELVPEEMAAMLDEPDAAESLEMMATMTPSDVRVLGGSMADGEATLQIEGSIDGAPAQGEVTMTRQGDFWFPTSSSVQ